MRYYQYQSLCDFHVIIQRPGSVLIWAKPKFLGDFCKLASNSLLLSTQKHRSICIVTVSYCQYQGLCNLPVITQKHGYVLIWAAPKFLGVFCKWVSNNSLLQRRNTHTLYEEKNTIIHLYWAMPPSFFAYKTKKEYFIIKDTFMSVTKVQDKCISRDIQ